MIVALALRRLKPKAFLARSEAPALSHDQETLRKSTCLPL